MEGLKSFWKHIPTFLLAFVLAVAVWISAVTQNDPTVEKRYPTSIPIEILGQDPQLLLTSELPNQVSLTLKAPQTVWDRISRDNIPVHAVADFTGLSSGNHSVPISVQIDTRPVEIVSYFPSSLSVSLEKLSNQSLPITIIQRGDPAIGYEASQAIFQPNMVNVSGPESLVQRVSQVNAVLDYNNASESINRSISLVAVDEKNSPVNGISLTPEKIDLKVDITQRGGYRNVVVKVVVNGTVSSGYRVTNISVSPPAVTVFSDDPRLVDSLPGFVETTAINISGAKENIDTKLSLVLADGISIVGEQQVEVHVGISAIEGSLTFDNMPLTITGLDQNLQALTSPDLVNVIVSGPLPSLEKLTRAQLKIILDLAGLQEGKTSVTPRIDFPSSDLTLEAMLPGSIEVTINRIGGARTPTPTPTKIPVTPTP